MKQLNIEMANVHSPYSQLRLIVMHYAFLAHQNVSTPITFYCMCRTCRSQARIYSVGWLHCPKSQLPINGTLCLQWCRSFRFRSKKEMERENTSSRLILIFPSAN